MRRTCDSIILSSTSSIVQRNGSVKSSDDPCWLCTAEEETIRVRGSWFLFIPFRNSSPLLSRHSLFIQAHRSTVIRTELSRELLPTIIININRSRKSTIPIALLIESDLDVTPIHFCPRHATKEAKKHEYRIETPLPLILLSAVLIRNQHNRWVVRLIGSIVKPVVANYAMKSITITFHRRRHHPSPPHLIQFDVIQRLIIMHEL